MPNSNPDNKATRRRRGVMVGAAVLLTVVAGVFTATNRPALDAWRLVDIVRIGGFLVLAFVLALRSTTAFSLIGRNSALDDELTRANRASAARVGFWTLFVAAIVSLGVSMVEPVSVSEVAPLLIAAGAVSAALRFAVLEGRGDG